MTEELQCNYASPPPAALATKVSRFIDKSPKSMLVSNHQDDASLASVNSPERQTQLLLKMTNVMKFEKSS